MLGADIPGLTAIHTPFLPPVMELELAVALPLDMSSPAPSGFVPAREDRSRFNWLRPLTNPPLRPPVMVLSSTVTFELVVPSGPSPTDNPVALVPPLIWLAVIFAVPPLTPTPSSKPSPVTWLRSRVRVEPLLTLISNVRASMAVRVAPFCSW
ncbi:hypothetical protein D3C86_1571490 [compost metagenome]